MFSIPLPLDDWSLLVALPWPGLSPLLRFPLIAGLVLVPLLLLIALYRYEMRLVRPLSALGLLGLRLLVLVLVLALVCLQPVVSHETRRERPGRVIVVVDRSASTFLADPQRNEAASLRLALAFGLHRPALGDDLVRHWLAEVQAGGEPTWRRPDELDADVPGRRKAYEALLKRVDALTRADVARLVLSPEGMGLLQGLTNKHQVELWGFNREVQELRPEQLDELFQPPEEAALLAAGLTDLSAPLQRAQLRTAPGQGQVLGVVLLTDGQHNSGPAPEEAARALGERNVPVYLIALGAKEAPPDAAIVSVRGASQNFYKDVEGSIEVKVKLAGLPAGDFVVRLGEEGKENVAPPQTISHSGKDGEYTRRFRVKLNEVGPRTLTASVQPAVPTREVETTNNRLSTLVNVADDRARILLVDGEARWEYHYLASALERDRLIDLKRIVFDQPRLDEKLTVEDAEKAGLPGWDWPEGNDPFGNYGCVILGDVPPDRLTAEMQKKLERFVGEAGGTLVVLGGKGWMPLEYTEGGRAGESGVIGRLLPVEGPRVLAPDEGLKLTLTGAGQQQPFMELEETASDTGALWEGWPRPWPWAVLGKAKPGAVPLLRWATPQDQRVKQAERERLNVVVCWQNYGFGRVLFVGLDSTWRLRYKVGDRYHHRFWGQVVRWAAGDRPLTTGNEWVRFGTGQAVVQAGDPVEVTARLAERLGPLKPGMLAGARVYRLADEGKDTEKQAALVPLSPTAGRPRMWGGQIRGLEPGRYAVELAIPELAPRLLDEAKDGQEPKPLRATFAVLPPSPRELIALERDQRTLDNLAARSGGLVFEPEEADTLRDRLVSQSLVDIERADQKLYQWWGTLLLVASLLTLEWVGRKLAGLR